MLTQMSIRNFALIEQMNISFTDGITIFTGETGAGKSILMDAFSILLGERASNEFIRHGKDSFVIDGTFDISQHKSLLTLLEAKKNNREASNKIFSEKERIYHTSKFAITKNITYPEWNQETIKNRQAHLSKLATGIWKVQY